MSKIKLGFVCLLGLLLLLSGCSKKQIDPAIIAQSPKITIKIVDVEKDDFVGVGTQENDNGLYVGYVRNLEYNFELREGQIVEIAHDGALMESYPVKIGEIYDMQLIEQDNDTVGLYRDVFGDLRATDPGIDENVSMVVLDVSGVDNLTKIEKTALAYLIQRDYTLSTQLGSYSQLKRDGLITAVGGLESFENGVLYSYETRDVEDLLFTFDASKWSSSKAAYFFDNCIAVWDDDGFTYKVGSEAVS